MANNTTNSSYNGARHGTQFSLSTSKCIPWFVGIAIECLAIVILNIITIIVFAKKHQLRRRSTYLIIHLSMVDFLVGAVSGPLIMYMIGSFCNLWKYDHMVVLQQVSRQIPLNSSLVNLTAISLERMHATFCPFKHRLIKKWIYGVLITVTWLTSTVATLAVGGELINDFIAGFLLTAISVSYISIFIKMRLSRHPQYHGAVGVRERKLTNTLFIVTLSSLITWLPSVIHLSIWTFHPFLFEHLSRETYFAYQNTVAVLVLANSLINPIIYAMRMHELSQGIKQIIFRRTPNPSKVMDLPLKS